MKKKNNLQPQHNEEQMRKEAREIAFKLIFQSEFNNNDVELSFMSIAEENYISDEDKSFAGELYRLYLNNKESIKNKISANIKEYEIERIYKIDLALLELALAEILYYNKTPVPIVINEVVELAKKYSTENSSKFINGVLANLIKEI